MKKFTKSDFGSVINCDSEDVTDLNARTIKLANEHGVRLPLLAEQLLARYDWKVLERLDDWLALDCLGDDAVDFLNRLKPLPYCSFHFNGGLRLNFDPDIETAKARVKFVSGDGRRGPEYPPADFRVRWLRVNDQGKATLYVRNAKDKDVEVWATV
jgi:hypothetical protein